MSTRPDDLALALALADEAAVLTMARFRARDLQVDTKPDLTWVSEADRDVEAALRRRLADARPTDAVLGEEEGRAGSSSRCWIVDPIDGTANYVRGVPVWATLISLEVDERPVLGVVSAPALGRRWWAHRGQGAFADGEPMTVSKVERVEDAFICYALQEGDGPINDRLGALSRRCWRTRGFGDFWQHLLVAEGAVDVAVDPEVNHWDVSAFLVVVEEAGGRVTDLAGAVQPDGGSALSTNGLLHEEVLAWLST